MKKIFLTLVGVSLFVVQPKASLDNGGFENGTYGWCVGPCNIVSSFTPQFITNSNWEPIANAFYGSSMLLLGSPDIGSASAEGPYYGCAYNDFHVTQEAIDNGLRFSFKWGALMQDPINTDVEPPYFESYMIPVNDMMWGPSTLGTYSRINSSGFTMVGTAYSGGNIWYGSKVENWDLSGSGLGIGDYIYFMLLVNDSNGATSILLDGFEWANSSNVPEPVTMSLLGIGFLCLAGFKLRRK